MARAYNTRVHAAWPVRRLLVVILSVWSCWAPTSALAKPKAEVQVVASAVVAVERILAGKPRVVAYGEYHQTETTRAIPSALRRFLDELLPQAVAAGSHLVVETWITEGRCGKTEEKVTAGVEDMTQRPAATESEVVQLIRRGKEQKATPHILKLSCAEYASLQPASGEGVDAVKLLQLVNDKLRTQIVELLAPKGPEAIKQIVIYGGALHNDLYPRPELATFTFGRDIRRAIGKGYVEIDLYVPEYIVGDKGITSEAWYHRYLKLRKPGQATLVTRGPGSYIIVFPEAPEAKEATEPAP